MKPGNEIGLVETPITDCSAVNDGYNLPLSQPVEIWEITYYLFIKLNLGLWYSQEHTTLAR